MTQNKSKSDHSICWLEGDIPFSNQFEDAYYSKADGLGETRHVFIKGNRLNERWPKMDKCTIAELGFGTGLNFLETVRQWQATHRKKAILHFHSFEQFPLHITHMEKALSHWPELDKLRDHLATVWESKEPVLDVQFAEDISLSIYFGDANQLLPEARFLADAWYLDGFSPAKNPQLWSQNLMRNVYDHTCENGTFATYTAAGWIRRNLDTAGFNVRRIPGYAGKRDMTIGTR